MAVLYGSPNHIFGIHEQQALLRFHQHLHGLRGSLPRGAEVLDELFEAIGGGNLRFHGFARARNSFGNARLVERLQNVIDGVYVESLDGVVIEGRGENDVRDFHFALDEFFQHAEAVESGHLDIEKNEVGRMFLDEVDGVHAVPALADDVDFRKALQQISQFFAGGLLVIHDDGVDLHGQDVSSFRLSVISFWFSVIAGDSNAYAVEILRATKNAPSG